MVSIVPKTVLQPILQHKNFQKVKPNKISELITEACNSYFFVRKYAKTVLENNLLVHIIDNRKKIVCHCLEIYKKKIIITVLSLC